MTRQLGRLHMTGKQFHADEKTLLDEINSSLWSSRGEPLESDKDFLSDFRTKILILVQFDG